MKQILILTMALVTILGLLGGCGADYSGNLPESADGDAIPPFRREEKSTVRLMGLSGPVTMGLAKLLAENEQYNTDNIYTFEMATDTGKLVAALTEDRADIATIPADLAALLYNTKGGIAVIAAGTLGVHYIVETGEGIHTLEDLRGKALYATGEGTSTQFVLEHLLRAGGIDPAGDITIEYRAEPDEVAAILAGGGVVAMLPQPYIALAMSRNADIRVALDITDEWNRSVGDSTVITGVAVVRRAFLRENPEAVDRFLTEYRASIDYANANVEETAEIIGELGIVSATVARTALPACNLTYMDNDTMQQQLSGFLTVLYEQNPDLIGGKLPDNAFYYKK